MKLFLAVAAVIAVTAMVKAGSSPSKKVRRGGPMGYAHPQQQQQHSLQSIIQGINGNYAYVGGVGSQLQSGSQSLAYAPQQFAQVPVQYAPQVAQYVPQVAQYNSPQVSQYAPVDASVPAYAPAQGSVGVAPGGGGGQTQISRSVYVFSAPHDPADSIRPQLYKTFPQQRQKHVQVVFINAPAPPLAPQTTLELPAPPELKTQIYVLVKKPQPGPPIKVIPAKVPVSKPEVFFIRYKNNGQAGGPEGPIDGPTGPIEGPIQGPSEDYGPPQGPEGAYPQEEPQYGPPVGSAEGEYPQQEEPQQYVSESDAYGGPVEGGISEEYGQSVGGPASGGDTYGEYSSPPRGYATIAGVPVRRRYRPSGISSLFRMQARSDSGESKWKPIVNRRSHFTKPSSFSVRRQSRAAAEDVEEDAGMSGI